MTDGGGAGGSVPARSGPRLRELTVGDDPASWAGAGFTVDDAGRVVLGGVTILLSGPGRGVSGWAFDGLGDHDGGPGPGPVDGIVTSPASLTGAPPPAPTHRNRIERIDHLVVLTPDLGRTVAALADRGLTVAGTRDVPGADPPRRQVFCWAGEVILEVVGPLDPTGDRPARIWGLALVSEDLDRTAGVLGPLLSKPRDAVQPGRRIATIRTNDLDISVSLAVMSPHLSR